MTEDDFVTRIRKRDNALPIPQLMFPSLQVNINAAALPGPENSEIAYLKVPLNYF